MTQAKSFAALYSRLSAKARQALRRKVTAEQALHSILPPTGSLNNLGVTAELVNRHKTGATLVVHGPVTVARIPIEFVPGEYSIFTRPQSLSDAIYQVTETMGYRYDNVHKWDFELRDIEAAGNVEISELRTRIAASLGPVHVTPGGIAFVVYELGNSPLVEYREPGSEYVTVVGLTKFLEVTSG